MDADDDVSSSTSAHSLSSEESPSYVSSSNLSSSQTVDKNVSPRVSLSHAETKAVNRSKVLVYIALVVCAVSLGTATYYITHLNEVATFEAAVSDCVRV